jgi:putative alpha-1,2-mannosidase
MGFTLTHLSGTGIPDLGDFLFMPQLGESKLVAGTKENPNTGYRARYSHDQEEASVGYYRVTLLNNKVTVELTATERAGMLRFTFPQSERASIMTDLQHFLSGNRFKLIWSHVRVEDNATITGFHLVNGWARERYLYFAARYSRPFDHYRIISNGTEAKYDSFRTYRFRSRNEAAGTNLQFLLSIKRARTKLSSLKWPSPRLAPRTLCKISIQKFQKKIGISTVCGNALARRGIAN